MPNPYIILAVVIAFVLSNGASYLKGHSNGVDKCEAQHVQAAAEQAEKERQASDKAVAKLESNNSKAKIVYRTITQNVDHIVEKPIYKTVCFDDDGIKSANAALTGKLQIEPPKKAGGKN